MAYFTSPVVCLFLMISLASHVLCRDLIKHKELIVKRSNFKFIKELQGSRSGDDVKGLYELKEYLNKFGYLDNLDATDSSNIFDDTLESAIKTYQLNYKLNITGVLDEQTVSKMMTPRCGVPDIINGVNTMHRGTNPFNLSKYAFFPGQPKWINLRANHLVYLFQKEFPENLAKPVADAFKIWGNKTRFLFRQARLVDIFTIDLRIGYYSYEHGDGHPFDGPHGIFAHAFSPMDGRVHFDASEEWSDGPVDPSTLDMASVALHEIGHLLGLAHTDIQDAVMYPYFQYGKVKTTLHQDDIDGINTLYGWN